MKTSFTALGASAALAAALGLTACFTDAGDRAPARNQDAPPQAGRNVLYEKPVGQTGSLRIWSTAGGAIIALDGDKADEGQLQAAQALVNQAHSFSELYGLLNGVPADRAPQALKALDPQYPGATHAAADKAQPAKPLPPAPAVLPSSAHALAKVAGDPSWWTPEGDAAWFTNIGSSAFNCYYGRDTKTNVAQAQDLQYGGYFWSNAMSGSFDYNAYYASYYWNGSSWVMDDARIIGARTYTTRWYSASYDYYRYFELDGYGGSAARVDLDVIWNPAAGIACRSRTPVSSGTPTRAPVPVQ